MTTGQGMGGQLTTQVWTRERGKSTVVSQKTRGRCPIVKPEDNSQRSQATSGNHGQNHSYQKLSKFQTTGGRCRTTLEDGVKTFYRCYRSGKINAVGERTRLHSGWNLQLLESLCTSSSDLETVEYLKYGWPLNRKEAPVSKTFYNHKSAERFPEEVDRYIADELRHGTLLGPFVTSPFPWEVTGISPMSTRPKKGSQKRRIIVDLSWPHKGNSVNAHIPKDEFMNTPVKLTYPTVDRLCRRAAEVGPTALGWKKDLVRAFRQVPLDPLAWSYLGVTWKGMLYFDIAAVMGCRSAPYVMQRVTTLIRHIMKNLEYHVFNYVDDFMSIDTPDRAWTSFNTMGRLLHDIGAKEAEDKMVTPTHLVEFLGVLFDLLRLVILLPEAKLQDIQREVRRWLKKETVTVHQLQVLAGKLQFASICVRPGRVFVLRLYEKIARMEAASTVEEELDEDTKEDIMWWDRYLQEYNGVSLMWMQQIPMDTPAFATDASLMGLGGICQQEFFHTDIPVGHLDITYIIAEYEMLALVLATKLWIKKFRGTRFYVLCDNQNVVDVINGQNASNKFMQKCLRYIMFVLATNQCEMRVEYIQSKKNVLPDLLSRWRDEKCRAEFEKQRKKEWIECVIEDHMFSLNDAW